MILVKHTGARGSTVFRSHTCLSIVLVFFVSNKQLDVFVYHIRKLGCQSDSAIRRLLLDLFATFQVILECEIYLYLCALVSHSTVIIQCVSEVNPAALSDNSILCAATPPTPTPKPCILSLISLCLRWREREMKRFWAAWVVAVSARWGRDGGTLLSASVG